MGRGRHSTGSNASAVVQEMTDRVFAEHGDWALASDGVQWILQRRYAKGWRNVFFVRSDRDILVRCMREKGTEEATARFLISGLPESFDQWRALSNTSQAV